MSEDLTAFDRARFLLRKARGRSTIELDPATLAELAAEIERLRAEVAELHTNWRGAFNAVNQRDARIAELEAALRLVLPLLPDDPCSDVYRNALTAIRRALGEPARE